MLRGKTFVESILVLLVARGALSCTCSWPVSARDAFGTADAVFLGEVVSYETSPRGAVFTFAVERQWKGAVGKHLEVMESGWSCDYEFTVGSRYLVYAHRSGADTLSVGSCSRTRSAWWAAFDTGALPPPVQPFKSSFWSAAEALERVPAERILEGLTSRDERTRVRSLLALESRQDVLAEAETDVVQLLRTGTLQERHAALAALRATTHPSPATLSGLVASLRHPAGEIRRETVEVFQTLARATQPAAPELVKLLTDRADYVRSDAVNALVAMEVSKGVLELSQRFLDEQDAPGRARIIESLELMAMQIQDERPVLARGILRRAAAAAAPEDS